MEIKEIYISKERKINIGNYETVGLNVGILADSTNEYYESDYQKMNDMLDAKMQYFEDKWKSPKKIADKLVKENINKYNSDLGF